MIFTAFLLFPPLFFFAFTAFGGKAGYYLGGQIWSSGGDFFILCGVMSIHPCNRGQHNPDQAGDSYQPSNQPNSRVGQAILTQGE